MTQKWKNDLGKINYWEYLKDMLGIEPFVYGIGGHQWTGIYGQAQKLKMEHTENVDAIFVFAGTNCDQCQYFVTGNKIGPGTIEGSGIVRLCSRGWI